MSPVSKPRRGVQATNTGVIASSPGDLSAGTRQAAKKSHEPPRGRGLQVRLARIPGHTKPGLLKDPFFFQVAPTAAFTRSGTTDWQDFSTLAGPASRGTSRGLTQYSLSSLFVDYDPTWAAYHYGTDNDADPVDPYGWLEELFDIRDSLTPVSLLVGHPATWGRWHVKNQPVSLRDVSDELREGEDDALYFSLSMVEFPLGTKGGLTIDTQTSTKTPAVIEVDSAGTARWEGVSGNQTMTNATLHKLAKWFYGDPTKWRAIVDDSRNAKLKAYGGDSDLGKYAAKHGRNLPNDGSKRKVAVIHIAKKKAQLKAEAKPKASNVTFVPSVA